MSDRDVILEMNGISKFFGHVRALEHVDFELYQGEVLALLGDNGAGKSTLIKIISGVYPPDDGSMTVYGKQITFKSPYEARDMGIETIYQDLALFDNMDVMANIFVGRETRKKGIGGWCGFVDRKFMRKESQHILQRLGIHIGHYDDSVKDFSGGQRQSVAIAKAVYWGHQIIIMDEPTAALGVRETEGVFRLINDLKKQQITVIVIMHNIDHVLRVAQRAIVLRRGKRVGTVAINGQGKAACKDTIVKMLM